MKNRAPALVVAVFVALIACKPRQEAASAVRADQPATGLFVAAEPRPNPLKKADFIELAKRLESILRETGQGGGLGLTGDGRSGDAPNGVASLASISWALGEVKAASEALRRLGADTGETQNIDRLVHGFDVELNKKAKQLRYDVLLEAPARDSVLMAQYKGEATADALKKTRDDALTLAIQQVGELKTGAQGFPGMECEVAGGSPTTVAIEAFGEEATAAVGQGLSGSPGTRRLGRGEGVCFGVKPGYPLFVFAAQKRCASGFQPDDPRVTLHVSTDLGDTEAFAYVLPPADMTETVCFSRSGGATVPVSAEIAPAPGSMAGAFKRIVSSIFSAPADCEGVAKFKADLCTNSECRAVASGKINDCYSKDCRAIILKRSSACGSTDCRGIIRRVVEDCVSNYCRAIVGNKPTECHGEGITL